MSKREEERSTEKRGVYSTCSIDFPEYVHYTKQTGNQL